MNANSHPGYLLMNPCAFTPLYPQHNMQPAESARALFACGASNSTPLVVKGQDWLVSYKSPFGEQQIHHQVRRAHILKRKLCSLPQPAAARLRARLYIIRAVFICYGERAPA